MKRIFKICLSLCMFMFIFIFAGCSSKEGNVFGKEDSYLSVFDTLDTEKPIFGEATGFEVKITDSHHKKAVDYFKRTLTLENYTKATSEIPSDYSYESKEIYKDLFLHDDVDNLVDSRIPSYYFKVIKNYNVESISNIELIKESEEFFGEDSTEVTYMLKYTLNYDGKSLDMVDRYFIQVDITAKDIGGKDMLLLNVDMSPYESSIFNEYNNID